MPRLLIAALVAAACGPSPAPVLVGKTEPAPATAPAAPPATPAPAATPATPSPAEAAPDDAPVKREPPLTPEEIELIETDPDTLTPEMRVKRAHALRRKILQNPDSPAAKQMEKLRREIEAGNLVPSVPGRSDNQLVLSAPTGSAPPKPEKRE